jgi:hypothetical protein
MTPEPDEQPAPAPASWPARTWSACKRSPALIQHLWESLLWLLAFIVLPILMAAFLYQLFAYWRVPPSWYFSIDARTQTASLVLPVARQTEWRIEGAVLCAQVETLGSLARQKSPGANPCGSSRWHAFALPEGQEQVLVVGGQGDRHGPDLEVTMEVRDDNGLQLALRQVGSGANVGLLRLNDQGEEIPLAAPLHLVWPGQDRPRDLIFPFTANRVRVGRDVSWSDSTLLNEGRLAVFTASEDRLTKRALVEEVTLLPGDQVRMEIHAGRSVFQPKGFLRFERTPLAEGSPTLTAVAFGRAESIRIERFGDSGYDFKPRWWAGLLQNSTILILTGAIGGLLGLLGGHSALRELRSRSPRRAWNEICGTKHDEPTT